MRRLALLGVLVAAAGCGGGGRPHEQPEKAALRVLDLIVHNRYSTAWSDLHSRDQKVAPFAEYVGCESRSPVIAVPRSARVTGVRDESVGLGDGTFVDSKAVAVRLGFAGGFKVTHTVHLVAEHGKWKWILPSWRFRDYRADRCPTDAGSSPPPSAT